MLLCHVKKQRTVKVALASLSHTPGTQWFLLQSSGQQDAAVRRGEPLRAAAFSLAFHRTCTLKTLIRSPPALIISQ
ncbi:Hypothetical protein, putative [Bodo saltans]|uniref:Uncharacterized protein n=1 Tax=Bodo saltans TaxID=75058 RepID=A0A0S4J298_BODSA|nr:Hypothetical protein, putative [Bodo saltans]|eukprot:CUG63752.1 Hypothetical protein, putative [Bodo saltans]